jgi:hypothetical protein
MAGGYIVPQDNGDHQAVQFIFVGEWTQADVDKWNNAIFELKKLFPGSLIGITTKGLRTPKKFWLKKKSKPKKKPKR